MTEDDSAGYAELWLSELGAWVPEHRNGIALAPRERAFGLHLPAHERAARHGERLRAEPLAARVHRVRSELDRRA